MRQTSSQRLTALAALAVVAHAQALLSADAPLRIVRADTSSVEWIEDGDFSALRTAATLANWRSGKLVERKTPDGREETCVEIAKSAQARGEIRFGHRRTVRVEIGHCYTVRVEYQTDVKGLYLQNSYYGFHTWGDTIRVTRTSVPASPHEMRTFEMPFEPVPGTICVGMWVAVPPDAQGKLRVRKFSMVGPPWGGVAYPPLTAHERKADAPRWTLIDKVLNSVPINTLYFGPAARNVFPIQRGRGVGAPWLPVGAIVPPVKGEYRIGVEVREPGGGPLLWRGATDYALAEDAMPKARMVLDKVKQSCAIEVVGWRGDGTFLGKRSLTLRFQRRQPFAKLPTWEGLRSRRMPWPGRGLVAIEIPGQAIRDFEPDKPLRGATHVTRGSGALRLALKVERYDRKVMVEKAVQIPAGDGTTAVPFAFTPPNPDVYEVHARVYSSDRLLDERSLRIGLRDPRPERPFVEPKLPELFLVEEQHFHSLRYAPAAHQQFADFLDDIKAHGSNTAGIGYYPADFNPMPGVYRFHELEERVELARKAGLRSLIYFRLHGWPEWSGWESPLDQNGEPFDSISAASAGVRKVVADSCAMLARHFRGDPWVVGYGRWNPWTDWTYRDTDQRHFDYCPSALALWSEFAGGAPAPQPLDKGPDMRPEWRRWAEFRRHLVRLWMIDGFGEVVRREDPSRWLVAYMMAGGHADMEALWPDFKRLHMYPAHGGSDPRDFPRHGELARRYGLVYRHESVSAPDRHPLQADLVIFHGLFNGLPKGVTPAFNVAWNIGWNHTHVLPGVVAAMARRRKLLDLVAELHRHGYDRAPNAWAQYSSWDDMLLLGRTFQWHWLTTSLELGDMFENISHDAVSDRTPLPHYREYKLVCSVRARVITAASARLIRDYVEAGGVFVVVLRPGPGMAELGEVLLGMRLPADGLVTKRVAVAGQPPWFAPGRRIVLKDSCRFAMPRSAVPIAVFDGTTDAAAWSIPVGKGKVLVFAGEPDMAGSKGFLEDILKRVGVKRRFRLDSSVPNDYYPAEGIEFTDGKGNVVLLVHRAIRWNLHRRMLSKAASRGVPPTWDGFAQVYPRADVSATYIPSKPARFHIARWADGSWETLGQASGPAISGPKMTMQLAPGEMGALRLTLAMD